MAMIPSNYEINVAKKHPKCAYGMHYCLIELGQALPEEAEKKFNELADIFGEEYNLTLTRINCYGEPIKSFEFGRITKHT